VRIRKFVQVCCVRVFTARIDDVVVGGSRFAAVNVHAARMARSTSALNSSL